MNDGTAWGQAVFPNLNDGTVGVHVIRRESAKCFPNTVIDGSVKIQEMFKFLWTKNVTRARDFFKVQEFLLARFLTGGCRAQQPSCVPGAHSETLRRKVCTGGGN